MASGPDLSEIQMRLDIWGEQIDQFENDFAQQIVLSGPDSAVMAMNEHALNLGKHIAFLSDQIDSLDEKDAAPLRTRIQVCQAKLASIESEGDEIQRNAMVAAEKVREAHLARTAYSAKGSFNQFRCRSTQGTSLVGTNACAVTATEGALDLLRGGAFTQERAERVTQTGVNRYALIHQRCTRGGRTLSTARNLHWDVDTKPFYKEALEADAVIHIGPGDARFNRPVEYLYYETLSQFADTIANGEEMSSVAQIGAAYFAIHVKKDGDGNISFRMFDSHTTGGSSFTRPLTLDECAIVLRKTYPSKGVGLQITPIRLRGAGGAGASGTFKISAATQREVDEIVGVSSSRAFDYRRSLRAHTKNFGFYLPEREMYDDTLETLYDLIAGSSEMPPIVAQLRTMADIHAGCLPLASDLGLFSHDVICTTGREAILWLEILQAAIDERAVTVEEMNRKVDEMSAPRARAPAPPVIIPKEYTPTDGDAIIASLITELDETTLFNHFKGASEAMTQYVTKRLPKGARLRHQVAAAAEFLHHTGQIKSSELKALQANRLYQKVFPSLI